VIRRLLKDFQGDVVAIPGRLIALIFFLVLAIIPLITTDSYLLRTLAFTNIFAIYSPAIPGR
jgi:type IV secretory pathway component VirB8